LKYFLFYGSIIAILLILFAVNRIKKLSINDFLIGLTTAAFSLAFDVTLGGYFKLYYYISTDTSLLYIVLAALFLYPPLNMIYTLFLPRDKNRVMLYTGLWMVAMLVFELISVLTHTIVFTGWKPFPWSILTYIITYFWVISLYRYLNSRCIKPSTN
jgi:hypothetical protein